MTSGPDSTAHLLLDWYDRHARDMPWRTSPKARAAGVRPDPYRVWLSEIMLQQTTVAAVKAYFERFVALWPTVEALAAAPEEDVMKAWAGLGYYSRARNLKACADTVARDHGGQFPDILDGLRALPGIGDYTAAAVAAIAFDLPAAVVDGNVERVFTRLFAIETPLPKAKPEIKAQVAAMLPPTRPGDFAQACMDLGATICTPRRPSCILCPLREHCAVIARGLDAERFPVKAAKGEKPVRRGAAYVLERSDGAILLERRPPSGLLGAMTQVPTTDWTSRRDGDTTTAASPDPSIAWRNAGAITHVFTHFELRLTIFHGQAPHTREPGPGRWWSRPHEIAGEALPSVMKKAIACALPEAFAEETK